MLTPGVYRIALDGEWSLEEFYVLPHTFNQVYAFHYAFFPGSKPRDQERLEHAFGAYPWQGGYSAVNFYNVLLEQVPRAGKPNVDSIRYASPGWIDLNLYVEAAKSIGTAVAIFSGAGIALNRLYSEIYKEASQRKLLRIKEQHEKAALRKAELDFVLESSKKLTNLMGFKSLLELNDLTKDPLATLKILLSYYRRIRLLADYEGKGKARFTRLSPPTGKRRGKP